jgi:hypothetical protein
MKEIKFRGKFNGVWMYVTPESNSWEQFWALVDKETLGQHSLGESISGGAKKMA